jgi:hypothetical protein
MRVNDHHVLPLLQMNAQPQEQLSLCFRFLDNENDNSVIIREEFVGFRHAKSVKGAAICDIIVRFLTDLGLYINKIRAQCYDGAANMAGKYSGVQARILQLNPEASYVHCKAHSLNLALIHSSKDVQEIIFSLIILPNDSWLFPRNYLKIKLFKNNWTDAQNCKPFAKRDGQVGQTLCLLF